ncbi:hypothetical protein [Cupriavidus sp. TMH.W2]
MVHLYEEHILAATHWRQSKPGDHSTVTDRCHPRHRLGHCV